MVPPGLFAAPADCSIFQEEAENERMHLMTFMTVRQPSVLFRMFVLGAQGVFYNAFCEP
jgi:hypothetical protein